MACKFFDKKFLVMPDDRYVIGKKVFCADCLHDLIEAVESGEFNRTDVLYAISDYELEYNFSVKDSMYKLAYYDPNYECKVAYSHGKTIQLSKNGTDDWTSAVVAPVWSEDFIYRVKPDTVCVHRNNDGGYYKDEVREQILFEGTEEECDAWIAEHSPKTRRMTNKELSRWLAEGKGQALYLGNAHTSYFYLDMDDDETVPDAVKIRTWSETKWHKPLVEKKIV